MKNMWTERTNLSLSHFLFQLDKRETKEMRVEFTHEAYQT